MSTLLSPPAGVLPLMEEYRSAHERLTELGDQIVAALSNGGPKINTTPAVKIGRPAKVIKAAPKKQYKKREKVESAAETESQPRMASDGKGFPKFSDWCSAKGLGYISYNADPNKYQKYYQQYTAEKKKSGAATEE